MTRLRAGAAGMARLTVIAVSAAMLLTGCAFDLRAGPLREDPASPAPLVEQQPDAPAVVSDTIDCRSPDGLLPPAPGSDAVPPPGAVPEGFVVVAALACDFEMRDAGTGDGALDVVALVTRSEGDFGPLLAALAAHDDVAPPDTACTLSMELVAPLWLEGADGGLVSVRSPVDACMKTRPAVREAFEALDVVSVEEWTPRD